MKYRETTSSGASYHAEKFAHLVKQLDEFSEGDGTLLDNASLHRRLEKTDEIASRHDVDELDFFVHHGEAPKGRMGQPANEITDRSGLLYDLGTGGHHLGETCAGCAARVRASETSE